MIALGLEVHVAVEMEVHVRPGALAESAERRDDALDRMALEVQRRMRRLPAIALHLAAELAVDEVENVGLQALEAARLHFGAELGDVVGRLDGLEPHLLASLHAIRAAMAPVDLDTVAHRAAEQGVHRQADGLAANVPQRHFDRRIGALHQATRKLDVQLVELRGDLLHRQRVLPDQHLAQTLDLGADRPGLHRGLVILGPADKPGIGGDLEEGEVPESGDGVDIFDRGDLHEGPWRKREGKAASPKAGRR